jgi:hypothetical protein
MASWLLPAFSGACILAVILLLIVWPILAFLKAMIRAAFDRISRSL